MAEAKYKLPVDTSCSGPSVRMFSMTVNGQTVYMQAVAPTDDMGNVMGTLTHPFRTDPTGTTAQPVSGSVSVSNFPAGFLAAQSGPWTVGVSGPVAVTGTFFQATQPVSGTFWQETQPVSDASLLTKIGELQEHPSPYTILDRLRHIACRIDAASKVAASEATLAKLLVKPPQKTRTTLLHGR